MSCVDIEVSRRKTPMSLPRGKLFSDRNRTSITSLSLDLLLGKENVMKYVRLQSSRIYI